MEKKTFKPDGYTLVIKQDEPSKFAKPSASKDAAAGQEKTEATTAGQEKPKDTAVAPSSNGTSATQEAPKDIEVSSGGSVSVSSIHSIFHLESLQVEKEMYQPGKIEAKIQVTLNSAELAEKKITDFTINSITPDSLKELFLGRKVTLKQTVKVTTYDDAEGKNGTTTTEDKIIAKDYLVFKFVPEYKSSSTGTSLYVTLIIYSPEKLLSFRKYNKCYVAKKLGDDIFAEITQNKSASADTKATPLFAISKNPQHLIVQVKDTPEEYIQPYLVQYDETALNFLNRVANRCGEFLFFEDGEWKLGAKTDASYAIYEYDSLTYHCSDMSEEEFFLSNNYTKSMPSNPGKPKDLPTDKEASQEEKDEHDKAQKAYDAYLAYEGRLKKGVPAYMGPAVENLASYEEQDASWWDSFTDNYELLDPAFWRENLSDWLKEDSLLGILGSVMADATKNAIQTTITYKEDAEEFNEKYVKPYDGKAEHLTEKDSTKLVSPLTNAVAVDNKFTNDFFTRILTCGQKAEEGAIHLKLDTYYGGFKLGDVFTLGAEGGSKYIITKVSLASSPDGTNQKYKATIDALPLLDGKAYPARLKDCAIRKVEPQTAIVTSTSDPFSLGRIQMRYPWQSETETPSSPWIRIAAPFTSKGAAIKFMPQKGDEIMVGYEYGDIERPFMIGSLQSKTNKGDKNAYVLKSPNGHYIKFNNPSSGKGFITSFSPAYGILSKYIPALADLDFDKLKEYKEFAGGITMGDKYGFYKINMSTDKRSVSIESSMGNVSVNALTGITISAPNGNVKIVGKNIDISAGNKLSIQSGTNIKTVDELAAVSKSSVLASSFVGSFMEDINKLKILDVSLIRTFVEAFLKPIGGNMLIKSRRFMRLEAGDGVTKLPKYIKPKEKTQEEKDEETKKKNAKQYNHFLAKDIIDNTISAAGQMVQQFKSAHTEKKAFPDAYQKALDALKNNVNANTDKLECDGTAIKLEELDQNIEQLTDIMAVAFDTQKKGPDAHKKLDAIKCTKQKGGGACDNFDKAKTDVANAIEAFVDSVQTCLKAIEQTEITNPSIKSQEEIEKIGGTYTVYQTSINTRIGQVNDVLKKEWQAGDYATVLRDQPLTAVQLEEMAAKFKKSIVYDVLYQLMDGSIVYISNNQSNWLSKATTFLTADEAGIDLKNKDGICSDADMWDQFVDCVEVYDEKADAKKNYIATAVTDFLKDRVKTAVDYKTWRNWDENVSVNSEVKGKILLSDNETYTTSFNEKQLENAINKPIDDFKATLKGF